MTVCLKCGAENPSTNQYCVRCEMPLPHSGAGHTLQGGALERPAGTQPLPVAGAAQTQLASSSSSAPAPVASPVAGGLARTLFGVSPTAPAPTAPSAPAAGAPAQAPLGLAQTLFGVAPAPGGAQGLAGPTPARQQPTAGAAEGPAPPEVIAPASAGTAGLPQRTLLGVAPQPAGARPGSATQLALPSGPAPSSAPLPRGPGQPQLASGKTAPFEPVRNVATMLGTTSGFPAVGRSLGAPSGTAESAPAASDAWPGPAASLPSPAETSAPAVPTAAPNPVHARTQLGVAIPGIAPLRAGGAAADATPQRPPELPASLPPAPVSVSPGPARVPRGALVLLGAGGLLLAAAVAFALLWRGTPPISAAVTSDASGRERIDLVCSDCPDGTQITLGEASAEVRDRKAYLLPETPLALGENQLRLGVQHPGGTLRDVDVRLPPVEYRIHPDTSTLVGDEPKLRLEIETLPGTRVQLGERDVPLDARGHGVHEIDVSGQLHGQSTEISTFEQAVPYLISSPSGKDYRGELRVKIGITPLLLEAPGTDSVTDLERFMLAGRTTSGAEVWVAGSALPVDASGRFAQLMSIESVGQTHVTVRATQRGLAPRFASFRLERVKSLDAALNARKQGALNLAQVMANIPGSVGKTLLLRGRIEEVRVEGQRSLLILAADNCTGTDCLARLSYGGLRKLNRGAHVTAVGKVLGTAGNQNVPEIEVSLLL